MSTTRKVLDRAVFDNITRPPQDWPPKYEFEFVEAWASGEFRARVNKLLGEGWMLFGHPVVRISFTEDGPQIFRFQAFHRVKETAK